MFLDGLCSYTRTCSFVIYPVQSLFLLFSYTSALVIYHSFRPSRSSKQKKPIRMDTRPFRPEQILPNPVFWIWILFLDSSEFGFGFGYSVSKPDPKSESDPNPIQTRNPKKSKYIYCMYMYMYTNILIFNFKFTKFCLYIYTCVECECVYFWVIVTFFV